MDLSNMTLWELIVLERRCGWEIASRIAFWLIPVIIIILIIIYGGGKLESLYKKWKASRSKPSR